jgi:hypothetical protein
MQNVAVKLVVTPLLIGGATMAGRRWGEHMGGWLVALPLTSGPIAYFLATEHGTTFAAVAATAMMAGTSSQVAFAMAYRSLARRGRGPALAAGLFSFAASTIALSYVRWTAVATFGLVVATLAAGFLVTRGGLRHTPVGQSTPPKWDVPIRMLTATAVAFGITAAAPVIGPHLAGLLSPLPVFGIVLAVFSHTTHGPQAAVSVLDGLVLGLLAPAVFFLVLALALPTVGLIAFAYATAVALLAQGCTMLALPRTHATVGP